jgi:uncharacterized protein YdeI (YjbR/CyaY-like superfamily)
MPTIDPRVDAYIVRAADFARPILAHLRGIVHAVCPEVQETIKWGMPHFEYKGPFCFMAAFKQHCTFGYWKGGLIFKDARASKAAPKTAMGDYGRIAALSDLPARRAIESHVREAMRLNDAGVKAPSRAKKQPRKPLPVPADLAAALRTNKAARETFDGFPPSHRREYIEWITEAKQEATRARRLATTLEWLAEGKSRNWKYSKC